MRDYKYEMLDKTTKVRQLSGEIHMLSEEILKDNSLSTSEKWEIIAQAQKYTDKQITTIPNFDIDILIRFNTDYVVIDHPWRNYGIPDHEDILCNDITAMLIENGHWKYEEVIYAYDFLKLLEIIRETDPEKLMFYKQTEVLKKDLSGDEYWDEIDECIVLTNADLDLAKEWFMREGIYFFRFKTSD